MMAQIRWLIAEKLLYLALFVAPDGDGKYDLADDIGAFVSRQAQRELHDKRCRA